MGGYGRGADGLHRAPARRGDTARHGGPGRPYGQRAAAGLGGGPGGGGGARQLATSDPQGAPRADRPLRPQAGRTRLVLLDGLRRSEDGWRTPLWPECRQCREQNPALRHDSKGHQPGER